METSTTVEIDAPPERVWDVLADVERWPEWSETVDAVVRLGGDGLGVGSRVRIEQPKLPPAEYVVTACEPGREFTWETRSPGVRVTAWHRVTPRGDGGSSVWLAVRQSGPVGAVMGRLFFKGLTERYLALEAAGLKARSELGQ